jgi:uncharacterized membrane protein
MFENMKQTVVASYGTHDDAEEAVRRLERGGVAMDHISIIGRDWQMREEVQGFYRPDDAMAEGAKQGAWFGGFFGLFMGMGMFVFPVVGALIVLGPLAGLIAGAIGGAGIGALTSGMLTLGIPKDQAVKYQERLQAGEFLVVVHDATLEETTLAHQILQATSNTSVASHGAQTAVELAA